MTIEVQPRPRNKPGAVRGAAVCCPFVLEVTVQCGHELSVAVVAWDLGAEGRVGSREAWGAWIRAAASGQCGRKGSGGVVSLCLPLTVGAPRTCHTHLCPQVETRCGHCALWHPYLHRKERNGNPRIPLTCVCCVCEQVCCQYPTLSTSLKFDCEISHGPDPTPTTASVHNIHIR